MPRRPKHLAAVLALVAIAALPSLAAARPTGFESQGLGLGSSLSNGGLSRGLSWLDPSRLSVSTSVSVGTGFSGGSQGLSVTRLGYQFGAPLAMSVGLGSSFGAPGQGSPFLESLSLRYQPSRSTMFRFEFHDVRSPLQLTRDRDVFARDAWWGY